MGKVSKIEWTDASWSPWYGCTKISEGCAQCYAFRWAKRSGRDPNAITRSKTTFLDPLKWEEPRIIFVCSIGDFFHKEVPKEWRDEAWKIIRRTPRHTYLILTKRPGLALNYMPSDWQENWDKEFSHVWLGVSVENQNNLHRVITMSKIPATILFVSAEPLLGPINFSFYLELVNLIIVGGESGPNPRPCDLNWIRSIRDQCVEAGVAFFVKQLGSHWAKSVGSKDRKGSNLDEFPSDLRFREFPNDKWKTQ